MAIIDLALIAPIIKKELFKFKDYVELKESLRSLKMKQISKKQFTFFFAICIVALFFVFAYKSPVISTFIMIGFTLSFTLIGYIGYCIELIKDYKTYNEIKKKKKNEPWNREAIGEYFYRFKTENFRLKFMKYLEEQNIKVKGYWEEGKIPFKNDKASTLLAKLEEKWLGLDR